MGKRSSKDKDEARVLYKKSQHTIYTPSRTCSGLSQIVQMKKNLSQTNQYYTEGEKVKRDLSIETDICILRRYFKNKKNRLSSYEGSKSRYSTVVDTEKDTIEDITHDSSACGDSERTESHNVQLDVAKIMMENFKYLLNNWIEKYLLDNKDTKHKLESVLYSLLHKTELDKAYSSSRSTYVLNKDGQSQEVKNEKIATRSIVCKHCQSRNRKKKPKAITISKESSYLSTPTSHKNIKVISTLSIPKNLHKKVQYNKSNHKVKKTKHKHLIPTIISSNMLNYSNFDILTVSTNSFTKRCVTYDCNGKMKKRKKKRQIEFFPKPSYKSTTEAAISNIENKHKRSEIKKPNLTPMPSLVKSIYADDPANITSTDGNFIFCKIDNFTMTDLTNSVAMLDPNTEKEKSVIADMKANESGFQHDSVLNEEERSDPMMTIDFIDKNYEFNKVNIPKIEICTHTRGTGTDKSVTKISKQAERKHKNKSKKVYNFQKMEKKRIGVKNNTSPRPSQRFLGHCENIIKHFADFEHKNNMKLDVHITFLPVNKLQNIGTEVNKQTNKTKSETFIFNDAPTNIEKPTFSNCKNPIENVRNIMPLLDGTDKQAKYTFKSESCCNKTSPSHEKNTISIDRSTITDIIVKDDINELKSIVKDLTKAAQTFIIERERINTTPIKHDNNSSTRKIENNSRGIQYSRDMSKIPLISGIKLSIGPKKVDLNDFCHRLMRKSTSYSIIDSECVLKVTDMTSAANEMNKSVKSFPNSRSMIEMTNDRHNKNLFTYYYDEFNNGDEFLYHNCTPALNCTNVGLKPGKICPKPVGSSTGAIITDARSCCREDVQSSTLCPVSIDVEKSQAHDDTCHRISKGFRKTYIIYIVLMCILFLLAGIFYMYVGKNMLYPKKPTELRQETSFNIKMSDLGFEMK